MWDLRYRPLKFEDVLGQEGAVLTLKARLRNGTALDTNYIFGGGHGQGKTSLARIMARAILCQNLNKEDPEPCNECDNCRDILSETSTAFFERDAASQGSKDHIRAIVDDLPFATMNAAKRVYLFDEAHRLTKDAQDVLLKPMEDGKMVAMLCTTEPDKIRGAIASRCLGGTYTVRKVTRDDVLVRMRKVLQTENVPFEDDAVLTVIDHSGGHVRDILNRLEMIGQMGAVTLDTVRSYLNLGTVTLYYDILLALGDPKASIDLVEQACDRVPAEEVSAGIIEAAMSSYRLANGMHADFGYVDREKAQKVYSRFGVEVLKLAEYLLARRYATRLSLVCDVVRLAAGVPAAPVSDVTAPPILISAPAAAPPPAAPAKPPSTPPPATPQVLAAPAPPAPAKMAPRPSGPDPLALTDLDAKAIPREMPRRPNMEILPVVFPKTGSEVDDLDLLGPDEWRREFERTWPGRV